jgi:hypothetical protein
MAQDFNLSDDMVIRFEQALQALSNASDAIDNASLVLRDGLYNARLTQRQEQEAREAARRAELERDRFLLLCANALSGVLESYLSRHRSAQEQPPQAADPQAEHTAPPPPPPKPKR